MQNLFFAFLGVLVDTYRIEASCYTYSEYEDTEVVLNELERKLRESL